MKGREAFGGLPPDKPRGRIDPPRQARHPPAGTGTPPVTRWMKLPTESALTWV